MAKRKLNAELFNGDMESFALSAPVDSAFNTYNTFRHLLTEEAAENHLRCVANWVRPGGIFILGLHLLPPDASDECIERWYAQSGKSKITYTLRVLETDRKRRVEKLRVNMSIKDPRQPRDLKLVTEFPLRMYTAAQMRKLFAKVPEFELVDVFDFCYEIDQPLKLGNELSDTVFILKRVGRAKSRNSQK
jgi:hypothetical protein